MQEEGYHVENNFDKVMEDPNVNFQNQMTTLGDYKKSTIVEPVHSKYDRKFPRYTKERSVKQGFCESDKLKSLQEYQRGT